MENMEKVVYLDNAATTPCAPEALEMMVKALSGACGNPSSHYSIGYEAKEFVDTGRAQVAKAINASPAELFFTLSLIHILLPYHTLGLFKWQKLGIPYPLPDAVPPTAEQVKRAEELLEVNRYPG